MTSNVVGYTTGVFDLFHVGHLNLLRRARALCDVLIVGVTTDELCSVRKGKSPVVPHSERMEIVSALGCVDRVVAQQTMDKIQAWRELGFQRMFVGDDWHGTDLWRKLDRDFRLLGVEIVYLPYTAHTSSTLLRNKLLQA